MHAALLYERLYRYTYDQHVKILNRAPSSLGSNRVQENETESAAIDPR